MKLLILIFLFLILFGTESNGIWSPDFLEYQVRLLMNQQEENSNSIERLKNVTLEQEELIKRLQEDNADMKRKLQIPEQQGELLNVISKDLNEMRTLLDTLSQKPEKKVQSYENLASGLASVQQEVTAVRLLEEQRNPQISKTISKHDENIQKLLNLTAEMELEISKLQKNQRSEENNCTQRLSILEQNLAKNKCAEIAIEPLETVIGTRLPYLEEIEGLGSGSGEEDEKLTQENVDIQNFKQLKENISAKLNEFEKNLLAHDLKNGNKIKEILTSVTQNKASLISMEEEVQKMGKKSKYNEEIIRKSLEDLRLLAEESDRDAERALMVANVVKNIQSDHFGELQNFKENLNEMETSLLRFGLKLTTLQADFLNSSLRLYQGSQMDHFQDLEIAKLQIKHEGIEKHIGNLSNNVHDLSTELVDKVSYRSWKLVEHNMDIIARKLTASFTDSLQTNKSLNAVKNALIRMETQLPKNCARLHPLLDGIKLIKPPNMASKLVICGVQGWTYIQQRRFGTPHFNKSWDEYARGFGDLSKDFWIGNNVLHMLTTEEAYDLQVDSWDIYGDYRFARFENFSVGSESESYPLGIGPKVEGNLTDSMRFHAGMQFSTYDKDNDGSGSHCAKYYGGGWWFAHCQKANPNGNFLVGLTWFDNSTGDWLQFKRTALKIRPFE